MVMVKDGGVGSWKTGRPLLCFSSWRMSGILLHFLLAGMKPTISANMQKVFEFSPLLSLGMIRLKMHRILEWRCSQLHKKYVIGFNLAWC